VVLVVKVHFLTRATCFCLVDLPLSRLIRSSRSTTNRPTSDHSASCYRPSCLRKCCSTPRGQFSRTAPRERHFQVFFFFTWSDSRTLANFTADTAMLPMPLMTRTQTKLTLMDHDMPRIIYKIPTISCSRAWQSQTMMQNCTG
jgi:hypothetical protein